MHEHAASIEALFDPNCRVVGGWRALEGTAYPQSPIGFDPSSVMGYDYCSIMTPSTLPSQRDGIGLRELYGAPAAWNVPLGQFFL